MSPTAALKKVRAVCRSLGAFEKLSHGAPTFFLAEKKPSFLVFVDNHHNDGRLALWCAAPPGAQKLVVDSDPDCYFVPPYVGVGGWIGMRLDRGLPWKSIKAGVESAFEAIATKQSRRSRGS